MKNNPGLLQLEKAAHSNKDPVQPKIINKQTTTVRLLGEKKEEKLIMWPSSKVKPWLYERRWQEDERTNCGLEENVSK